MIQAHSFQVTTLPADKVFREYRGQREESKFLLQLGQKRGVLLFFLSCQSPRYGLISWPAKDTLALAESVAFFSSATKNSKGLLRLGEDQGIRLGFDYERKRLELDTFQYPVTGPGAAISLSTDLAFILAKDLKQLAQDNGFSLEELPTHPLIYTAARARAIYPLKYLFYRPRTSVRAAEARLVS